MPYVVDVVTYTTSTVLAFIKAFRAEEMSKFNHVNNEKTLAV